jgi:hypothetical protein
MAGKLNTVLILVKFSQRYCKTLFVLRCGYLMQLQSDQKGTITDYLLQQHQELKLANGNGAPHANSVSFTKEIHAVSKVNPFGTYTLECVEKSKQTTFRNLILCMFKIGHNMQICLRKLIVWYRILPGELTFKKMLKR